MEYSKEFIGLVNSLSNTDNANLKFIGTGNPNANILIIGQEVALDRLKDGFEFHYGLRQDNVALWKDCINKHKGYEDIEVWGRSCNNYMREDFSPLFPYYGDQKLHKSTKNGGTSKTWKCYQKLLSLVYPWQLSDTEADFHKFAFISEMSSIPFPKSPAKNPVTAESIRTRTTELFSHEYFKQFPVIVVASGNYVSEKMYGIDLQGTFNQRFIKTEPSPTIKSEWINIHENNGRLLLHCRQLSYCSDDLIMRLAGIIKGRLEKFF